VREARPTTLNTTLSRSQFYYNSEI
jgi:hypothetical protein